MAAYDRVLVEISGAVAIVTLNRPDKLNAFDKTMCDELIAALRMVGDSEAVRAVILTGAGRGFSAGADLGVLGDEGPALVAAGKEIVLLLRGTPKPVLAAVNGAAAGGGANLALACDYRIASDQARIGQVFHRLGLVPDWGGFHFLPRLVGPSKALELVWSARMVDAAEAQALGLFDRVVPAADLLAQARALAASWAAQPRSAVAAAKTGIYESERRALTETLDWEIARQIELFATPEVRERLGGGQSLATRSR